MTVRARSKGFVIAGVIERHDPEGGPAPLVFDSPHSGAHYPADFDHAVPRQVLRRAEDAFVDELLAAAPRFGATLLRSCWPGPGRGALGRAGRPGSASA